MNAGDHDHPALFEPTEDEMREAQAYEDWQASWERQTQEGMPYHPRKLSEAQVRGSMTDEEWQGYLADCDSRENIQEP